MKWDVFPNYKVPIEYLYYDETGTRYVEHIGWISTPDIQTLKNDHIGHVDLVKP